MNATTHRSPATRRLDPRAAMAAACALWCLSAPAGALEIGTWGAQAGAGGWTQEFEYGGDQLYDPNELLAGFSAGGWLDLGTGVVAPRVEVLYQERGSKSELPRMEQGEVVGTSTVELRGHYLSVPVTVKFAKVGTGVRPYLAIGLGAEFLLGWSADTEGVYEDFRTVTLGGHLLTGLDFTKLGIQVRFYRDLINPYQPVEGGTLEEVINQGFTFHLTMKLGPSAE